MTVLPERPQKPLTADTFDDGESPVFPPSSLTIEALRKSVWRVQTENGRTYETMTCGKFHYPHDEGEDARLEIQHNVWLLTLQGKLGLSPTLRLGPERVLDAGTGSGIWAVDYAEINPESEVIGVDITLTDPILMPGNCSFQVDDLKKYWAWSKPFNVIFIRAVTGCFTDMQDIVKKAYENLERGGYLEMQDLAYPFACDDGTLKKDTELCRLGELMEYLEEAGFVNIVVKKYKWPLNQWPKDKHYKEIGAWTCKNMISGLEDLLMTEFTKFLGWKLEEVKKFFTVVKEQLQDTSIHAYIPVYVVYGEKPEKKKSQKRPAEGGDGGLGKRKTLK